MSLLISTLPPLIVQLIFSSLIQNKISKMSQFPDWGQIAGEKVEVIKLCQRPKK